jgi:hypothetical protein
LNGEKNSKNKGDGLMKDRQFHIYLDDEEFRQVLQALIALKNNLIAQGRYRQRNAVIKEIIRKHLRAQSDIKVKTTNPFAKDFQMTPPRDSSGIIQPEYVPVPVKQTVIKPEKSVGSQVKEESIL